MNTRHKEVVNTRHKRREGHVGKEEREDLGEEGAKRGLKGVETRCVWEGSRQSDEQTDGRSCSGLHAGAACVE